MIRDAKRRDLLSYVKFLEHHIGEKASQETRKKQNMLQRTTHCAVYPYMHKQNNTKQTDNILISLLTNSIEQLDKLL